MSRSELLKRTEALLKGDPPEEVGGLFGASIPLELAELVILGVPYDGTASYGKGCFQTPEAIVAASHQLDFENPLLGRPYQKGIALKTLDEVQKLNQQAAQAPEGDSELLDEIADKINQAVYQQALALFEQGKKIAVLGGDHSVPFGLMKLLDEKYSQWGILHIDAHFDLRTSYEGYKWSHASIMSNVLEFCPSLSKIASVGIRDFNAQELETAQNDSRVSPFLSQGLFAHKAKGGSFHAWVDQVLGQLPAQVYISFDIDGLDPSLCPHTGTPVPGGLSYEEATYLLHRLAEEKEVIGFDLVEACPDPHSEWDMNVAARLLYFLCGVFLR